MFEFLKKMKITSFLIIMLIASFIPIIYTIVAVSASEHYAGVINIAGRQRMLNQRFLKEILLAKNGAKTESEKTLKLFLKSLEFLLNGGTLSIGDGEISLGKPSEKIKNVLNQVKTLMTKFIRIKDKSIHGSDEDFIAGLGTLFELNKKIHQKSNEVVVLFQKESESANLRTILFELMLGILGGIVAVLVILSIRNRIGKLNSAIVSVAKEIANGNLSTKIASDVGVDFTSVVDSIGDMTKAYTKPLFIMSSYFKKFASGEISNKIDDEYENDLNEVKININSLIDTLGSMLRETGNIISFVKEGELDHRTDPSKFQGKWKELLLGINDIVDSIALPFDLALNFISDVSVGKKLKRIDGDFHGK